VGLFSGASTLFIQAAYTYFASLSIFAHSQPKTILEQFGAASASKQTVRTVIARVKQNHPLFKDNFYTPPFGQSLDHSKAHLHCLFFLR
jgi:hypothetical protein